ncbi:Thioredoxin superfamily protein, partial [Zea mays]
GTHPPPFLLPSSSSQRRRSLSRSLPYSRSAHRRRRSGSQRRRQRLTLAPSPPVLRTPAGDPAYYTGYPKDLGRSRIIPFTSERQFVQLLHEGRPVVVAFTIKCTYTQHLDKVLEEAAAKFYPHIKFVRVECPKYPGFCLTRQRNEYPFVEVFYNPEQAASPGKSVDPNITKYSVKVLPFNYDQSVYGFREYFKKHGFKYSETN